MFILQTVCVIDIIVYFTYTNYVRRRNNYPKDELYITIGKRIRDIRQKKGFTQAKLADASSLSRTSITNIEHGRQQLPLHTLYDIAIALNHDVSEFLPKTDLLEKRQELSEKIPSDLHKDEHDWIKELVSGK